jgi:large subunit ribosomal protein L10
MDKKNKEKEMIILTNIFSNLNCAILTTINNIQAYNIYKLRKKLYKNKIKFKIIKNSIAKIIIKKSTKSILIKDFKGSTAIAWGNIEINIISKIFTDFQEEIKKTIIKSGFYNGTRLNINTIRSLSKIQNFDTIKINLLVLIKLVSIKLLSQILTPATNIVFMLKKKL